jgi:molybdenum cofactor biosynthesis protein B
MSCYDSPSAKQHRAAAPASVACAALTVSDTRTLADDKSGALIVELLEAAGHRVVERAIVRDEPTDVAAFATKLAASAAVEAILITGGTGIAARDSTPEALRGLFAKELPGFGELFRMLSFQEIGSAAMLSRALGGIAGGKLLFALPGSTAAVELAMTRLILPELAHLLNELRK